MVQGARNFALPGVTNDGCPSGAHLNTSWWEAAGMVTLGSSELLDASAPFAFDLSASMAAQLRGLVAFVFAHVYEPVADIAAAGVAAAELVRVHGSAD